MQTLPRLVVVSLAVLLCALVVWWATKLMAGATIAVPPTATAGVDAGGGRVDAVLASARLFGSRRPGVLSDNVRALGVVADASGRGSVIVSVDGQAPKIYRVGDTLDGRLVSAIRPEEIELEAGGARQVFRLPPARVAANGMTILGTGPAPSTPGPQSMPPEPSTMPAADPVPGRDVGSRPSRRFVPRDDPTTMPPPPPPLNQ